MPFAVSTMLTCNPELPPAAKGVWPIAIEFAVNVPVLDRMPREYEGVVEDTSTEAVAVSVAAVAVEFIVVPADTAPAESVAVMLPLTSVVVAFGVNTPAEAAKLTG